MVAIYIYTNIFIKSVGITAPKSIETKGQCADKGKEDSMRNKVQYEAKAENIGIQQ